MSFVVSWTHIHGLSAMLMTTSAVKHAVVYGNADGEMGRSTDLAHIGSWCNVSDKTLLLVGPLN